MTIRGLDGDRSRIEADLKSIVAEFSRCRKERIKTSTRVLDDLGIDSFTALEILVAVENKYSLKISEGEIRRLSTFGDLVSFVYYQTLRPARIDK